MALLVSTFNRTKLELKFGVDAEELIDMLAFNRTKLELKWAGLASPGS